MSQETNGKRAEWKFQSASDFPIFRCRSSPLAAVAVGVRRARGTVREYPLRASPAKNRRGTACHGLSSAALRLTSAVHRPRALDSQHSPPFSFGGVPPVRAPRSLHASSIPLMMFSAAAGSRLRLRRAFPARAFAGAHPPSSARSRSLRGRLPSRRLWRALDRGPPVRHRALLFARCP